MSIVSFNATISGTGTADITLESGDISNHIDNPNIHVTPLEKSLIGSVAGDCYYNFNPEGVFSTFPALPAEAYMSNVIITIDLSDTVFKLESPLKFTDLFLNKPEGWVNHAVLIFKNVPDDKIKITSGSDTVKILSTNGSEMSTLMNVDLWSIYNDNPLVNVIFTNENTTYISLMYSQKVNVTNSTRPCAVYNRVLPTMC